MNQFFLFVMLSWLLRSPVLALVVMVAIWWLGDRATFRRASAPVSSTWSWAGCDWPAATAKPWRGAMVVAWVAGALLLALPTIAQCGGAHGPGPYSGFDPDR